MKSSIYFLTSAVFAIASTFGASVFSAMTIGSEPLFAASKDYLELAWNGLLGTLFLIGPFLAVGWVCTTFHKRKRGRIAFLLFVLGMFPLSYFYIEGHIAAEHALADERWTAAALSIGLLPFVIGIPVLLLVALASFVALAVEHKAPA